MEEVKHDTDRPNLPAQKKQRRSEIRRAERELAPEYKAQADAAITSRLLHLPEYTAAKTVFAFVGMKREIDTTAFLNAVLASGRRLCVPLCTGEGIMEAKEIRSLDSLIPGTWGILEPDAACPTVPAEEIDFAVLPCVSCSTDGRRLGQGGGYYDRFLVKYRGASALICREALMTDDIPTEPHDIRLPLVVSENGVYRNPTEAPAQI